jgi:hypothetical protein
VVALRLLSSTAHSAAAAAAAASPSVVLVSDGTAVTVGQLHARLSNADIPLRRCADHSSAMSTTGGAAGVKRAITSDPWRPTVPDQIKEATTNEIGQILASNAALNTATASVFSAFVQSKSVTRLEAAACQTPAAKATLL